MDSIDYYQRYAGAYFDQTVDINMEEELQRFTELLPENAEVLDLGCGSGRDTVSLIDAGCYVTPMDGSEEMCRLAEIHTDTEVLNITFDELDFDEVFDGIWACASLLHVEEAKMKEVMDKVINALVPGGILYMSFHYGHGEEYRNGRLFHDYTEENIHQMLKRHDNARLLDVWVTEDTVSREEVKWLNVLVKKAGVYPGETETE